VLVDVVVVAVVQVAVVQVVDVITMAHRDVAAAGAVLMRVVGMVRLVTSGHGPDPHIIPRGAAACAAMPLGMGRRKARANPGPTAVGLTQP
jgi:hypothetical protein